MSAQQYQLSNESESEQRLESFKRLISVLIAIVTLAAAIVAYLQSDAGGRDDRANRDNKRYALEALGREVSGDSRVNFDYNTAYQSWQEYDLLATSAENREDDASAARYIALRDRATTLSPMLAAPYFNAETGEVDINRYEADTYLVEVTALQEKFLASSNVKDAWDTKSNTYIVHLTLLAVALFLFGLSVMISGVATRWILAGAGITITGVALVWAGLTFAKPVDDLRERGNAIDSYATGVGLAYQSKYEEAIAAFDGAIAAAPNYANALAERARAHLALGNNERSAADFVAARAAGDTSSNVAGELAWTYHLLGRFDDAVAMNRTALAVTSDELWIQYDLGLSLLAAGKIDEAKAEYAKGMASATQQVADAKAAGRELPSDLWWGLDDAASGLDELAEIIDNNEGIPAPDKIVNPDQVRPTIDELIAQVKSLSVGLEYNSVPPTGTLTAKVEPFFFGVPLYDDNGEVTDYEPADTVPFGTKGIAVIFDYADIKKGQQAVFKVYVNGEEDPSWRIVDEWEWDESGSFEIPLSLEYSENFVLAEGFYEVELYIDSHLAQRGFFEVVPE